MDQAGEFLCNVPGHQFDRYARTCVGKVVRGEPGPTRGDETAEDLKQKGWVGVYRLEADSAPAAKPGEELTMEGKSPA